MKAQTYLLSYTNIWRADIANVNYSSKKVQSVHIIWIFFPKIEYISTAVIFENRPPVMEPSDSKKIWGWSSLHKYALCLLHHATYVLYTCWRVRFLLSNYFCSRVTLEQIFFDVYFTITVTYSVLMIPFKNECSNGIFELDFASAWILIFILFNKLH